MSLAPQVRWEHVWWERRWLWLPAALFVLVGLALLLGYQLLIAGRLGLQAGAITSRETELEEVAKRRRETEALVARARTTRHSIDELYDERLGSEAARLTAVMLEVKQLARKAGLSGIEAISYDDDPVANLPLIKKSITFNAQGGYEELRGFINLLELSPSFLSLDEIRVQGEDGGQLRLQVRLSTMFLDPDERLASERPAIERPASERPAAERTGGRA